MVKFNKIINTCIKRDCKFCIDKNYCFKKLLSKALRSFHNEMTIHAENTINGKKNSNN